MRDRLVRWTSALMVVALIVAGVRILLLVLDMDRFVLPWQLSVPLLGFSALGMAVVLTGGQMICAHQALGSARWRALFVVGWIGLAYVAGWLAHVHLLVAVSDQTLETVLSSVEWRDGRSWREANPNTVRTAYLMAFGLELAASLLALVVAARQRDAADVRAVVAEYSADLPQVELELPSDADDPQHLAHLALRAALNAGSQLAREAVILRRRPASPAESPASSPECPAPSPDDGTPAESPAPSRALPCPWGCDRTFKSRLAINGHKRFCPHNQADGGRHASKTSSRVDAHGVSPEETA